MIDYKATSERAFKELASLADKHDGYAQALAIHANNFKDVALGRMGDLGPADRFMRQSEAFFRNHGLLVEMDDPLEEILQQPRKGDS